jgi:methylene-fatty-acyl-phospholipid synthase
MSLFPVAVSLAFVSLPHILYAYIWTQPEGFMRFNRAYSKTADPVQTFASIAVGLKFVQFAAFFTWYLNTAPLVDFADLGVLRILIALVLFAAGQALNVGIFNAVGTEGVYYGIKLGKKIPWATG